MAVDYIEARINKVIKIKVSELMGSPAMTLDHESAVVKAGSIMVLRRIKQMPVMKGEKLAGIVTLTDIFRKLIETANKR